MPELVGSPGDQRRFRTDHRELDPRRAAEVDEALDILASNRVAPAQPGDSRVPRRGMELGQAGAADERPGEGVLTPARADDEDAHGAILGSGHVVEDSVGATYTRAPSMATRVIVSAADRAFFGMLQGLVRSIRDQREASSVDVAVLDLGLAPEQRLWLEENAVHPIVPRVSVLGDDDIRSRAFSARPVLPECVPGYEEYLWIDADAWVQDWAAVELFFAAAAGGALAIVYSVDRGYDDAILTRLRSVLGVVVGVSGWIPRAALIGYGRGVSLRLALKPLVNAGVFAMRARSPGWAAWAESYRNARFVRNRPAFDQVAVTHAIFERGLEVEFLPAWCNWICSRGLPKVDPAEGRLVEPCLPHRDLGIVHLVHAKRDAELELAQVGGGTVVRTLTYPGAMPSPPSGLERDRTA
jgi:hypothetical protein